MYQVILKYLHAQERGKKHEAKQDKEFKKQQDCKLHTQTVLT